MWHVWETGEVHIGRRDGKRLCRRSGRRWEGNIKIDHPEVIGRGVDWIELAHDRDSWQGRHL